MTCLRFRVLPCRVITLALASCVATAAVAAEPDFNRDVRPILSQFCLKCHGPDEASRQGGLRLDQRETALQPADSGLQAIVPGQPDQSELLRRITSQDDSERMPPPQTHQVLSAAQRAILQEWIAAGAGYEPHWAFVAPRRPEVPAVKRRDWLRNPVDAFVLQELESRGQEPSPEADRYTLIRRLSLDLTGLPPTPAQVTEFLEDTRPDAYERLVDRLLASPRYGERWARDWLDLARYADTNGYEKDRPRSVWPYRDWVIQSLNADMPFDQFTIEQLAGDLLPEATLSQRIATGFHRNTMLNEEGGIDPLEFRFHALTDRVATTGTVWLGLTVSCAQCHTHKYDPLTHDEYYSLLAFLNNADEPDLLIPDPAIQARRQTLLAEIEEREREMPRRFPARDPWQWSTPDVVEATSARGATFSVEADQIIAVSGESPDCDTYTILVETRQPEVAAIRIEALTGSNPDQPGPGRTAHGNFVITGLQASLVTAASDQPATGDASATGNQAANAGIPRAEHMDVIPFQSATADFSQDRFPAEHAIDDHPHTGWAIQGTGKWNVPRQLSARLARRVRSNGTSRWVIRIEQNFGGQHTLGRFRVQLGTLNDSRPLRIRRQDHLQQKFGEWKSSAEQQAVRWTVVRPESWTSTLPRLEQLDDGSLLASGDLTKRDVYDLSFGAELNGATAIRLEVLPDDRLPRQGPGLVYYEGPRGDFFLSELEFRANDQLQPWAGASHTFANSKHTSAAAIDGNPLTGWSIDGGQGQAHAAVFRFEQPLPESASHRLRLIFERYYAAALGRFRVSVTHDRIPADKPAFSPDLEAALVTPAMERTSDQKELLLREFCRSAPELASERAQIDQVRRQLPELTTALVMSERPDDQSRVTHRQHRGEYLQPREAVAPGVPEFLPDLDAGSKPDRLTLANWLLRPDHPLTARVTVNRQWQAFFGRGLVRTSSDFGYQGELPTHPRLLDWLALEFQERNWSLKELHRLIVCSAVYRQQSTATAAQFAADPDNRWLGRGPRGRLTAEQIRDSLLAVSGLLSDRQLGPSVFPPQPASVTTEGTYGKLDWNVSTGEDRYRRGLYTFTKRTAPYAMFATFDGPSGEACTARRDSSNTPLQALTLLNDPVVIDAARQLGQEFSQAPGSLEDGMSEMFLRILIRPPTAGEHRALVGFWQSQHQRLQNKELSASAVNGTGNDGADNQSPEMAAWTATARVLLNLDEAIVKP